MPQVFPDSVTSVQKFTRKRLRLTRSPMLSTANPSSVQEEACFPSRNYAAHEEREEKKQCGGENYPWAFSNSWSEVHFPSHPNRRQHDPRLAPARAQLHTSKQLPWFCSCTAWLLQGQPQHLLVLLGTCHPHGANPALQMNTAPDSRAGNNPGWE